jgi:hypothetical protein
VLSPVSTKAPPVWLGDGVNLTPSQPSSSELFQEQLCVEVARALEEGNPCSLLVLEPTGDCELFVDLLVGVALVEAGEGAAVFAVGCDGFALLLPGTPLPTALSLAGLLELRLAFLSEGRGTVAIGAAAIDGIGSAEELFARADLAMLEAKELDAPTAVAFGSPLPGGARFSEAGTARLLADILGFDRVLDAAARAGSSDGERLTALIEPDPAAQIRSLPVPVSATC